MVKNNKFKRSLKYFGILGVINLLYLNLFLPLKLSFEQIFLILIEVVRVCDERGLDISKLSKSLQEKILKTKFEEIMLYLIELKGVDFLYSIINNSDNQSQKFIQTVESNRLNKLTIKELSFLSNMSVSTFKRKFEKHFHNSPSKWFQDKRLEHSAFLLKSESKRPSDIYEEIGYENLSNFIQAFKLKYDVTPKQYQSN